MNIVECFSTTSYGQYETSLKCAAKNIVGRMRKIDNIKLMPNKYPHSHGDTYEIVHDGVKIMAHKYYTKSATQYELSIEYEIITASK